MSSRCSDKGSARSFYPSYRPIVYVLICEWLLVRVCNNRMPTSSVFLFHILLFEKYHSFDTCMYVICISIVDYNFAGCVLQSINHMFHLFVTCSLTSNECIHTVFVTFFSGFRSKFIHFCLEEISCGYSTVAIFPGNYENVCSRPITHEVFFFFLICCLFKQLFTQLVYDIL